MAVEYLLNDVDIALIITLDGKIGWLDWMVELDDDS